MIRFHRFRGSLSLCLIAIHVLVVTSVLAMPVAQETPPCTIEGGCDEEPLPPPSIPEAQPPLGHEEWEGFSDGRLNPEMTEYYSVWCRNDLIQVLRSIPSPETVDEISLAFVNQMGDGIPFFASNGMPLIRNGDTITLSGSNGNLAPQPGTKTFSLSECNGRNGGEPSVEGGGDPGIADSIYDGTTCEDTYYYEYHKTECASCDVSFYRENNLWTCMPIVEKIFTIGYSICMNPLGASGSVVSFAFLRCRRKRKM